MVVKAGLSSLASDQDGKRLIAVGAEECGRGCARNSGQGSRGRLRPMLYGIGLTGRFSRKYRTNSMLTQK